MKKGKYLVALIISVLFCHITSAETLEQEKYFSDTLTAHEQLLKETFGNSQQRHYYAQIQKYLQEKSQNGQSLNVLGARLQQRLALLDYDTELTPEKKHKLELVGEYAQLIMKENEILLPSAQTSISESVDTTTTQKVEQKILSLQKLIHTAMMPAPLKTQFANIFSGKKQTGQVKVWGATQSEDFGSYSGTLSLDEIDAYAKGFDSQLSSQLRLELFSQSGSEQTQELGLTTWLEMIQKNADTYIKLKNLEVSISKNPLIASYIELLKKMAKDEKYTRLQDQNNISSLVFGYMQQAEISEFIKNGITTPLYTPDSASGSLFTLVPTDAWCTLGEMMPSDLQVLVDTPMDCDTQSVAQHFREQKAQATLDMSDTQKTVFHYSKVTQDVLMVADIVYTDTQILSFHYSITPNQTLFPREGISLDFEAQKYFSVHANIANVGNIDITSRLTAQNHITQLDAYALLDNTFTLDAHIQDRLISGSLVLTRRDYSSEEVQYIPMIQADISGNMDEQDSFAQLLLDAKISGLISSGEQGTVHLGLTPTSFDVHMEYLLAGAYSFIANIKNTLNFQTPTQLSQEFLFDLVVDKDGQSIAQGHIQAEMQQEEADRGEIETPSEFVDIEDIDVGSQVEIME